MIIRDTGLSTGGKISCRAPYRLAARLSLLSIARFHGHSKSSASSGDPDLETQTQRGFSPSRGEADIALDGLPREPRSCSCGVASWHSLRCPMPGASKTSISVAPDAAVNSTPDGAKRDRPSPACVNDCAASVSRPLEGRNPVYAPCRAIQYDAPLDAQGSGGHDFHACHPVSCVRRRRIER